MEIRHIDLNLLRIFDAVYAGRSVVSAVQFLGIPQPTVDEALTTLRLALRDPLFVRTPNGMAPTAVAKFIGQRVRTALKALDGAMGGAEDFDPKSSMRKFSILVNEIHAIAVVPQLVALVRENAPGVQLELLNLQGHEVPQALAAGRVEFAISHFPAHIDIDAVPLFDDHHVLVVGNWHSNLNLPIAQDALPSLHFIRVGSSIEDTDPLHLLALDSNVRMTVPNTTMLPEVLIASDLAVMLPSRTARQLSAKAPLMIIQIAPPLRPFSVSLQWKRRAFADSGNQWLRSIIQMLKFTAPNEAT